MRVAPGRVARCALAVSLAVGAAACGPESGTMTPFPRPSTASTPLSPSPRPSQPLRVVDGWTGAPVRGAVVRTDTGDVVTTAADTLIDVSTCDHLSIDAGAAYLERHVYCRSRSLSTENAISLWPIASAREREETEIALFKNGRLTRPPEMPHYLEDEFAAIEGSREAWTSAAAEIDALTGGAWHFDVHVGVEGLDVNGDAVVVRLGGAEPCAGWSVIDPVFRYCYANGPGYFVPYLLVDRAFAARRDLALRALLRSANFAVGLLPGVTSGAARTSDLSDAERKMLHMVGLRPVQTKWPDWEF